MACERGFFHTSDSFLIKKSAFSVSEEKLSKKEILKNKDRRKRGTKERYKG